MTKYSIRNLEVGQGVEKKFFIDEELGKKFAEISGDFNPVHLNDDYAKKTMFRGKIAHGMLLGSFISGILGNEFPGEGTIYLKQDFSFLKPVRYGDCIKICVVVNSIDEEKSRVELQTDCYNQKGEKVLLGKALVMLPQ